MPRLPSRAPSVQIQSGGVPQVRAQNTSSGIGEIATALQRAGQTIQAFDERQKNMLSDAQALNEYSRQNASLRLRVSELKASVSDPVELEKQIASLQREFSVGLDQTVGKQLGARGNLRFKQQFIPTLNANLNELIGHKQQLFAQRTIDETNQAVDNMVRDAGSAPPDLLEDQLRVINEGFDNMNPAFFPKKEQQRTAAMRNVAFERAKQAARDNPIEVGEAVEDGSFTISLPGVGTFDVVDIGERETAKVLDISDTILLKNQQEARRQQQIQEDNLAQLTQETEAELVDKIIAGDADVLSQAALLSEQGGQRVLSAAKMKAIFNFQETVQTARAKGGAGDPQQFLTTRLEIRDGLHTADSIMSDPATNWAEKQTLLQDLSTMRAAEEQDQFTRFDRQRKAGKEFLKRKLKVSDILGRTDATFEPIAAQILLEYDNIADRGYEKAIADGTVDSYDPSQAAIELFEKRAGLITQNEDAGIEKFIGLLQPYVANFNEPGALPLPAQVERDFQAGRITKLQRNLFLGTWRKLERVFTPEEISAEINGVGLEPAPDAQQSSRGRGNRLFNALKNIWNNQ